MVAFFNVEFISVGSRQILSHSCLGGVKAFYKKNLYRWGQGTRLSAEWLPRWGQGIVASVGYGCFLYHYIEMINFLHLKKNFLYVFAPVLKFTYITKLSI